MITLNLFFKEGEGMYRTDEDKRIQEIIKRRKKIKLPSRKQILKDIKEGK